MKIFKVIPFFFLSVQVFACEMCGNFMGITPYDNQGQLMFLHRYRVFNGYRNYQQSSKFFVPSAYKTMHEPTTHGDSVEVIRNHSSKDYETFKVFELRGKFFLHPRWEVNFILPIQQIKTKYDEDKMTNTGLADPSLFFAYHLVKRLTDVKTKQRLIIGGGVKLPMGNYMKTNDHNDRIFLLEQNGTGSWDEFFYVNYMVSRKWFGINANTLFKINGENKYEESLGNSINQTLSLFARISLKNITFFPSALMNYEFNKGLFVDHKLSENTNTNVMLLGPSLDVRYKQFVLNASYQFNVYERVSSQSLANAGRFIVGLTFNFKQGKYLLKNKA
jgi:hypothetical protein